MNPVKITFPSAHMLNKSAPLIEPAIRCFVEHKLNENSSSKTKGYTIKYTNTTDLLFPNHVY